LLTSIYTAVSSRFIEHEAYIILRDCFKKRNTIPLSFEKIIKPCASVGSLQGPSQGLCSGLEAISFTEILPMLRGSRVGLDSPAQGRKK
jgi:hypothetical protein